MGYNPVSNEEAVWDEVEFRGWFIDEHGDGKAKAPDMVVWE